MPPHPETLTLWSAYQYANKRRCSLSVTLAPGHEVGVGRTGSLRVAHRLIDGHVAVREGTSPDWILVTPAAAHTIEVTR